MVVVIVKLGTSEVLVRLDPALLYKSGWVGELCMNLVIAATLFSAAVVETVLGQQ